MGLRKGGEEGRRKEGKEGKKEGGRREEGGKKEMLRKMPEQKPGCYGAV